MSQPSSGASRERAPSLEDDERSPDIREHIKDYLAKLGFKSDPAVADMLSEYGERKLIAYRKTEGVAVIHPAGCMEELLSDAAKVAKYNDTKSQRPASSLLVRIFHCQ